MGVSEVSLRERFADALTWAAAVVGEVRDVDRLLGGWTSTMLRLTPAHGPEAVLRLMTEERWRPHGAGLTARESQVQAWLEPHPVPAPRSLALDAEGAACGHPAHLMTLLPGRVHTGRADHRSTTALAELLTGVHAVPSPAGLRDYQSWAWEAKYVVPAFARDHGLWGAAFALLRTEPPAYEPTFLHRDFGPHNVLWGDDGVTGLVDWVESSVGPAWLDVAHGATNLAVHAGADAADAFVDAYVARTGRASQPYYDVMDVVGFLPPPGATSMLPRLEQRHRLEDRLRVVLTQAGA